MIDPSSLDPTAIVVGAVLSAALGAAWYSPLLFGPQWMAELGRSTEELRASAPAMTGSIVSCLVAAATVDLLRGATCGGWRS